MCKEEGTMWKKNTARFLILPLTSLLLSPGCATLTRKKTQRFLVTSAPMGATVIVNGVEQGVTPLELRLGRKTKGQVIRIEYPGYDPLEIRPIGKMSGGPILRNFLLALIPGTVLAFWWAYTEEDEEMTGTGYLIWGLSTAAIGGIFTAIDSVGAGYELEPKELTVTLTKAVGTPRVDTLVIEAEDFKNIKWIRVHRD
jgi:hypothetical protein